MPKRRFMKSRFISIALTAHVDAGKTTLSESILYHTGVIRKAGRVDHGDSFFDNAREERARGITIFSKEAEFPLGEKTFTLIDTPGHADFSAEMERVLNVLDYAVLIISAPDGVRGQDLTLWKLFRTYRIPVFVFVNKMDLTVRGREEILTELQKELGEGFLEFPENTGSEVFLESAAMLDENVMQAYLEGKTVTGQMLAAAIAERRIFPVVFGSALKDQGVDRLLELLSDYTQEKEYPEAFSARVFKITRDSKGNRLSHVRITGGILKAKDLILADGQETKAEQILKMQGGKTEQLQEAEAGRIVALTGLKDTRAGSLLGAETVSVRPLLVPIFSSRILPPEDVDPHRLYDILKSLEEEIPEIRIETRGRDGELHCQLMGEVQTDVIRSLLKERWDMDIRFAPASIVYKETITAPVYCAGHYEPLKHYAEVHLVLEPLERGSGVEAVSALSEDVLPRHFQRLILTHVMEKAHTGTLTGGEMTDVRVVLVNARAHAKHTEGGDFRQATYRAIRQGLMKSRSLGECMLLEPWYSFELRVPRESAGRAMTDLSRIAGSFDGPDWDGETAVFCGRAAVSAMQGYDREMISYTGGFGRLALTFDGYDRCRDEAAALAASTYDPELDPDNPSGSVFCVHGAGYYMPWDEVDANLHLGKAERQGKETSLEETALTAAPASERDGAAQAGTAGRVSGSKEGRTDYLGAGLAQDRELEAIFLQTLGANRRSDKSSRQNRGGDSLRKPEQAVPGETRSIPEPKKQFLLVDGYNIIFGWDELKELAAVSIDSARAALTDILANYQGYKGMTLILVFDAYKVRGGQGSIEKYHNIYIVYTKEAQTADAYIEATVHEIGRKHRVMVATSDGLEQTIVFGEGAMRLSARELKEAVEECNADIFERFTRRETRLENRIGPQKEESGTPGDQKV